MKIGKKKKKKKKKQKMVVGKIKSAKKSFSENLVTFC